MKFILTLIGVIAILTSSYGSDVEWEFDNFTSGGFKALAGKNFAALDGVKPDASLLVDGLYGKALYFTGSKYQVKIKHSAIISLKNNFTIRVIFKPSKIDSYRTLLWKGNRNVKPQQVNYYLNIKDGILEFQFKDRSGKWFVVRSKALIKINRWYYAVITMDKQGLIKGYLNGKECFRKSYKPALLIPNTQPAYIGAGESYAGGGLGYPFDGLIDRLEIASGVTPPLVGNVADFKKRVARYNKQSNRVSSLNRQAYIKVIVNSPLNRKGLKLLPLAELKSLASQAEYYKFFSKQAAGNKILLTVLPTASRILQVSDYSSGKFTLQSKAVIAAAKNEYEGFQIIALGNPETTVNNIKLEVSDLISSTGNIISANKLEWGVIRSIKTIKPKYDIDYVGDYPDAIMEGQPASITVPKNGFTPIYIRVGIARNVVAGNYRGEIKVGSQSIPIELKVYNFRLPTTNSFKVVFSFFENFYSEWYNKSKLSDEEKMYIYDFLLKYRITPNNIYSKGIYPELKFMPELRKKGANFISLGYLRRKQMVSPKELKEIVANYRDKYALVKKAGFAKESYLYAFDEISEQHKPEKQATKQIMTVLKQELPDLKTIQTSSPMAGFINEFDIWVPLFSYFMGNQSINQALNKQVKEFWWYCADQPQTPLPNFFLDYPVLNNRIIFTLSYMYQVKGILYWSINREWSTNMAIRDSWPAKPWKPYIINIFTQKKIDKNGMGNLVYPGKNGRILPSLRLENLRDGIEDYEYLQLLKKLVAKQGSVEGKKLLQVPPEVAVALNQYSSNPEKLLQYRNKVALMIEKLNVNVK